LPQSGRPGRVPDRDCLWAGRRRHERQGHRSSVRCERSPSVQSAHCACP
jgi:hypothetical protein